jgi:hypothetical protein
VLDLLLKAPRSIDGTIREALTALAARDPAAARKYLDRLNDAKSRSFAEDSIAQGIAQGDPTAGVKLATQKNDANLLETALLSAEERGPGALREAFAAADGHLGATDVPRLIFSYPDLGVYVKDAGDYVAYNMGSDATKHGVDFISPDERAELLANYDKLPAALRPNLAAELASSWARTDPEAAANWALAHAQLNDGANPANLASTKVLARWVNEDAESALNWWKGLPSSPLRDAIGNNASTFLADEGDVDSALQMFHPHAGADDAMIATQLAQYAADDDPAKAGAWLATLPAEADLKKASAAVIDAWYVKEPEAAARWVQSLPAGVHRDEATRAFTAKAAEESPEDAAEWVGTIADQKLRKEAALSVYYHWNQEDPAAAHAWMAGLTGVDEAWHARFLRTNP